MQDAPAALIEFMERERARPAAEPPPRKPWLTPKQVLRLCGLPYLPLSLRFPVPYEAMLNEALCAMPRAVRHREGESRGWTALMLHGLSSSQTMDHRAYGLPDGLVDYRWTELSTVLPVTTTFVRSLGYDDLERVRVLILEPGGWIMPHADPVEGLGPLNVALNNPDGCEFAMEGAGILPFSPGMAIMPAVGRRHAVWNRSALPRLHLLINGEIDALDHWMVTLPDSYRQACA